MNISVDPNSVKTLDQIAKAIENIVAIINPEPIAVGSIMISLGVEILTKKNTPIDTIHRMIDEIVRTYPDYETLINRMQIKIVK